MTRAFLAFLFLVLTASANAADRYVRAGASGANNGTSWTDAWTSMSSVSWTNINAGDTLWIAAGTYGPLSATKSGSSGSPITIKRATIAAHGAASGWNNAYDGQVIIEGGGYTVVAVDANNVIYDSGACCGIEITGDFITVDGVTRYGIRITGVYYGIDADDGTGANNITVRYVEIGSTNLTQTDHIGEDCIQGKGDAFLLEYSYLHDCDSQKSHGDGVQWFGGSSVTMRYNVFENTGQIFKLGEENFSTVVDAVDVYYNVFRNRGGGCTGLIAPCEHYWGMVLSDDAPATGRTYNFYNNTFDLEAINNDGFNRVIRAVVGPGTVNFKNNAIQYSDAGNITTTTHTNNGYDNSSTYADWNIPTETNRVTAADLGFVDVSTGNYNLLSTSALRGAGVNVSLSVDWNGNAVPNPPDIGAFQFQAGDNPSAPANFRLVRTP